MRLLSDTRESCFAKFVKANVATKSLGGSFRRGMVVVSRWVVNLDGKASDNFSEAVRGACADRVWLRNSRR